MSATTLHDLLRLFPALIAQAVRRARLRSQLRRTQYELAYLQQAQVQMAHEERDLHLLTAVLRSDLRALGD